MLILGNTRSDRRFGAQACTQGWRASRERIMEMLKKVVFALVAGSIALGATACNTVKGAGRDVESVGEAADKAL